MNNIISATVHDLQRTSDGIKIRLGQGSLKITNTVQRVIDQLDDLYAKRASKSHGRFSDKPNFAGTETNLKAYTSPTPEGFDEFTAKMMDTLLERARTTNAAGGHVFFAHFEQDASQYLMVVIITDKLGAALSGTLDVQDVTHLDVDGFRFAGRINITAWQANEDRYIGFLQGKGSVSDYFREFLGCDISVREREDTQNLVKILEEFPIAMKMNLAEREDFLTKATGVCARLARNREEIDFTTFANELYPKAPDELTKVLADPAKKLNDGFVPQRAALAPLMTFKGSTQTWSIEFGRQALATKSIVYNAEDNTLIIKNLPNDLIQKLKREVLNA